MFISQMVSLSSDYIRKSPYFTSDPRPRTLPRVVPRVVPRTIPPRPRTVPVCDGTPLPRVDPTGTVFLSIPRPRVGVFEFERVVASSFAFSAASAAFWRANSAARDAAAAASDSRRSNSSWAFAS